MIRARMTAKPVKVTTIEVDSEQTGQRLDNFLLRHLKGVPRSRVYRLVRQGEVRINKGRVRPSYRLQQGDRVRIPPVRSAARVPVRNPAKPDWMEDIIYDDEELLVLNKPAGIPVHGGSGFRAGVIEVLRHWRPQLRYLDLVHRLDKDTSGCLLIAKRRRALTALNADLRQNSQRIHRVQKRYLALMAGKLGSAQEVKAALEKNQLQSGERMVKVNEQGRYALSRFHPLQVYVNATLVSVQLYTGRTHQARVHAAHLGHPIAGDEKYGDREFNALMRDRGLRRLFLHAQELVFNHPISNRKIKVQAPLPVELSSVLDRLKD